MKAKKYLQQIKTIDAKIDSRLDEIATLDAIAKKTTSVMGGERVQASGTQDKMADCVLKIVELKQELNWEIDRFIDYRKEARNVIENACDADCQILLYKRYIGVYDEVKERIVFKTWEQIAVEMGLTYQWVAGGLHQRALAQVQKYIDKGDKKDGC